MAIDDEVQRILYEEWDPIGVSELDGPRDEYAQYGRHVVALLKQSASEDEIFRYLRWAETDNMGMGPSITNEENTRTISKLLKSLGGKAGSS